MENLLNDKTEESVIKSPLVFVAHCILHQIYYAGWHDHVEYPQGMYPSGSTGACELQLEDVPEDEEEH